MEFIKGRVRGLIAYYNQGGLKKNEEKQELVSRPLRDGQLAPFRKKPSSTPPPLSEGRVRALSSPSHSDIKIAKIAERQYLRRCSSPDLAETALFVGDTFSIDSSSYLERLSEDEKIIIEAMATTSPGYFSDEDIDIDEMEDDRAEELAKVSKSIFTKIRTGLGKIQEGSSLKKIGEILENNSKIAEEETGPKTVLSCLVQIAQGICNLQSEGPILDEKEAKNMLARLVAFADETEKLQSIRGEILGFSKDKETIIRNLGHIQSLRIPLSFQVLDEAEDIKRVSLSTEQISQLISTLSSLQDPITPKSFEKLQDNCEWLSRSGLTKSQLHSVLIKLKEDSTIIKSGVIASVRLMKGLDPAKKQFFLEKIEALELENPTYYQEFDTKHPLISALHSYFEGDSDAIPLELFQCASLLQKKIGEDTITQYFSSVLAEDVGVSEREKEVVEVAAMASIATSETAAKSPDPAAISPGSTEEVKIKNELAGQNSIATIEVPDGVDLKLFIETLFRGEAPEGISIDAAILEELKDQLISSVETKNSRLDSFSFEDHDFYKSTADIQLTLNSGKTLVLNHNLYTNKPYTDEHKLWAKMGTCAYRSSICQALIATDSISSLDSSSMEDALAKKVSNLAHQYLSQQLVLFSREDSEDKNKQSIKLLSQKTFKPLELLSSQGRDEDTKKFDSLPKKTFKVFQYILSEAQRQSLEKIKEVEQKAKKRRASKEIDQIILTEVPKKNDKRTLFFQEVDYPRIGSKDGDASDGYESDGYDTADEFDKGDKEEIETPGRREDWVKDDKAREIGTDEDDKEGAEGREIAGE